MVYKKYIKRNGKFYGPYIYNSRRVNGKVISEYHGTGKKDYKRFAFFILGILILAVSVFAILNSNGKISGNVVADNQISSQLENALVNESVIYPNVYFTLILNRAQIPEKVPTVPETNVSEQPNSIPTENQIPTEQTNNNSPAANLPDNQTIISTSSNSTTETSTTSTPAESAPIPTDNSSSTSSTTPTSIPQETPTTTTPTETISSQTPSSTTTPSTENLPATTSPEPANTAITSEATTSSSESSTSTTTSTSTTQPSTSEPVSVPAQEPTSTSSESTPSSPVATFFLGMLKTVSNFFLSFLSPTGMAVSDSNSVQINGEVSANKTFSYTFNDGENVQLSAGSVKTNSKSLPDSTIKIVYQNNSVLISTDYSEKITALNKTINTTPQKTYFNVQPLSDKEKEILNSAFGNYSIQTAKSEVYNGRYVVEYVLGDYNIKYSYDSDLNNETLNTQMENDRTKWLRDISNQISSAESAV